MNERIGVVTRVFNNERGTGVVLIWDGDLRYSCYDDPALALAPGDAVYFNLDERRRFAVNATPTDIDNLPPDLRSMSKTIVSEIFKPS